MAGQMSLRVGCLASLQALQGSGTVLLTSDGCGRTPCESLASYDRVSESWRIPAPCSLFMEATPSAKFSGALPTSGMMCSGTLYPLPRLVQDIAGKDSGYWLPTPIARDWKDTPGMSKTGTDPDGSTRTREDTLPRAIYVREKSPPRSGIVNPALSLWLMGYPEDWLKIA
jgi:hypothetical protein